MTGKERLEAVIDHKKPDRLPLYIPTVASSVASEILGRKAETGADSLHFAEEMAICLGKNALEEFEGHFYEDCAELNRALRVDIIRETWRSRGRASKRVDEYTLLFGDEDGEYYLKRFFPETQTYGVILDKRKPRDPEDLLEEIQNDLLMPEEYPELESCIAGLASQRRMLDMHAGEDLGEIISGGSFGLYMSDMTLLQLAVIAPEVLLQEYMRAARQESVRMRHLAGLGYRWFNGGNDMATNTSTIYSPKTFREVMLEPLKLFAGECRNENAVFCYRSDGNMWDVFDMMFGECGVQAYGEVDRDASMTVAKIRERNPELIILGNMSSALLHQATEEMVREETKKQLDESGGMSFIPGPSNAIVSGTPVKNIFAMIEEIERFRS